MNMYPGCYPMHNKQGHIVPLYVPVPKLATAYVPFQYLMCLYSPMEGLERGTIFPELDRPYGLDPEYTYDA